MSSATANPDRRHRISEILEKETPRTGACIRVVYTPAEVLDVVGAIASDVADAQPSDRDSGALSPSKN